MMGFVNGERERNNHAAPLFHVLSFPFLFSSWDELLRHILNYVLFAVGILKFLIVWDTDDWPHALVGKNFRSEELDTHNNNSEGPKLQLYISVSQRCNGKLVSTVLSFRSFWWICGGNFKTCRGKWSICMNTSLANVKMFTKLV